ncbi:MAG: hypothetical protein K2M15_00915 [Oscillospiraceae bacterium]|nr:hypothetical protein [Oscillospiraceae bacterium]MDE7170395.1 hypothetical protein [Oscillospiraceae bacterium]
MPEITQGPITGREYRFEEDSFSCKDCSDPVRYEDITKATNVPGNCCFYISFTDKKGKTRKVTVILDSENQIEPLRAMLQRKIPHAAADNRPETVWEAVDAWVTLGLCLAVLVGLIIALNTWGRGASVSVPIWLLPFLMIGSFLSTGTLIAIGAAILLLCGIGAAVSLAKRKTVWEITTIK